MPPNGDGEFNILIDHAQVTELRRRWMFAATDSIRAAAFRDSISTVLMKRFSSRIEGHDLYWQIASEPDSLYLSLSTTCPARYGYDSCFVEAHVVRYVDLPSVLTRR